MKKEQTTTAGDGNKQTEIEGKQRKEELPGAEMV